MKNENLPLGDYRKTEYGWDKRHKRDFFYFLLPLTIVSCVLLAAAVVGLLKLAEKFNF